MKNFSVWHIPLHLVGSLPWMNKWEENGEANQLLHHKIFLFYWRRFRLCTSNFHLGKKFNCHYIIWSHYSIISYTSYFPSNVIKLFLKLFFVLRQTQLRTQVISTKKTLFFPKKPSVAICVVKEFLFARMKQWQLSTAASHNRYHNNHYHYE